MPKGTRSRLGRSVGHITVGGVAAGLVFMPLTIAAVSGPLALLEALDIGLLHNVDDFFIAFPLWPLAMLLGAIAGPIVAAMRRRRPGRVKATLWAAAGGLFASLAVVMLMAGVIYVGWMTEYEEQRSRAMRPGTTKRIPSLKGHFDGLLTVADFESISASPDGKSLAYATNHQIILRDLDQNVSHGQPLAGHTNVIKGLSFSRDGRWLVSGSYDGTAVVWSVATQEPSLVFRGHEADVVSVALSPDGEIVASVGLDGVVLLWDRSSGEVVARVRSRSGANQCLDFAPNGTLLAICSSQVAREPAIVLWDVDQMRSAGSLDLPDWTNGHVLGVSFGPHGRSLAGAATHGPVVWDVEQRRPLGAVQEIHTQSDVDFSPDGRWFVSAGEAIYLWDAATREPVGELLRPPFEPCNVLFLPDGRLVASYGLDDMMTQVGIWTIETP